MSFTNTPPISLKPNAATFLGYLETGGFSGFYAKFRDLFFKTMGTIGVASYILLNAATPTI